MKKIFVMLAAVAAFTSCVEKDDTEIPTPENTGDYPSIYSFSDEQISCDVNLMNYDYHTYFSTPPTEDFMSYYNSLGHVDFMTRVATLCTGNAVRAMGYEDYMEDIGYFLTDDLNKKAGGDYVYIGFGGEYRNLASFECSDKDADGHSNLKLGNGNDDGSVITGLRLVSITSDRGNVPETIVDPVLSNVTWHIAPSYYGSKNMNSKTRKYGDALYLYYTRDFTGRKLTIANPAFVDIFHKYYNLFDLSKNKFLVSLLGAPCSWSSSNGNAWNVDAEAMIGSAAWLADHNSEIATTQDYNPYNDIEKHVDFIRLYDRNMEQTFGDDNNRPANFNRNGGGHKMFVSYSYITADSEYWECH